MSLLVNLLPQTQNTGEVNDPPPGGASGRHFLLGPIFHHFLIGAFPMSLSAVKINWQVSLLFKLKFKKFSQIWGLNFGEESSFSVLAVDIRGRGLGGRSARTVCPPAHC